MVWASAFECDLWKRRRDSLLLSLISTQRSALALCCYTQKMFYSNTYLPKASKQAYATETFECPTKPHWVSNHLYAPYNSPHISPHPLFSIPKTNPSNLYLLHLPHPPHPPLTPHSHISLHQQPKSPSPDTPSPNHHSQQQHHAHPPLSKTPFPSPPASASSANSLHSQSPDPAIVFPEHRG